MRGSSASHPCCLTPPWAFVPFSNVPTRLAGKLSNTQLKKKKLNSASPLSHRSAVDAYTMNVAWGLNQWRGFQLISCTLNIDLFRTTDEAAFSLFQSLHFRVGSGQRFSETAGKKTVSCQGNDVVLPYGKDQAG